MGSIRYDRVSEEIRKALCDIVRNMKDPRVAPMTTVMHVEAASDLMTAKVWVSILSDDIATKKETIDALNRAEGFIAKSLGKMVDIRRIPKIKFILDDSSAYSVRIAEILNTLNISNKDKETVGDGDDG